MKKTASATELSDDEQHRQPRDRAEVAPELDRRAARPRPSRAAAAARRRGSARDRPRSPARTGGARRRCRRATRMQRPGDVELRRDRRRHARSTTIARMTKSERVHRRQSDPELAHGVALGDELGDRGVEQARARGRRARVPRRRGSPSPSRGRPGTSRRAPPGTPYSPRETTAADVQPSPRAALLVADVLDRGVGGRRDRRRSAHLDDLGAALARRAG